MAGSYSFGGGGCGCGGGGGFGLFDNLAGLLLLAALIMNPDLLTMIIMAIQDFLTALITALQGRKRRRRSLRLLKISAGLPNTSTSHNNSVVPGISGRFGVFLQVNATSPHWPGGVSLVFLGNFACVSPLLFC